MNIKEAYVLNLALDGKQILSLPNFDELKISNLLVNEILQTLIQKGYLADFNVFTDEGLRVVRKIQDYKKAKRYIKIGNLTIAPNDNQTGIMLENRGNTEFYFSKISLDNCYDQISSIYPFIELENNNTEELYENISYEQLLDKYPLTIDNSIYISTLRIDAENNQTYTNEVVFHFEGDNYIFDRTNNVLSRQDKVAVQHLVNGRTAV